MTAEFRIGATIDNFFNPGAPITNVVVTNITDAFFEVQYLDVSTPTTRVFSWHNTPTGGIRVVTD
jgi:hypothetical protein